MLKTLRNLFKQDKEKFVVPKSVQSVIPIKTIWADGIFLVGSNKYAKTFKFEDINYTVASREQRGVREASPAHRGKESRPLGAGTGKGAQGNATRGTTATRRDCSLRTKGRAEKSARYFLS